MEGYEERLFDEIREALLKSKETTSAVSSGSGVPYYTIVNIKKNNKNRKYLAETYGKLKAYLGLKDGQ